MLAQFSRFMVALVAIGFAAFVADSLLRITEKAAEIVLPLDSLEQFSTSQILECRRRVFVGAHRRCCI